VRADAASAVGQKLFALYKALSLSRKAFRAFRSVRATTPPPPPAPPLSQHLQQRGPLRARTPNHSWVLNRVLSAASRVRNRRE
jgi:hypothetical protein